MSSEVLHSASIISGGLKSVQRVISVTVTKLLLHILPVLVLVFFVNDIPELAEHSHFFYPNPGREGFVDSVYGYKTDGSTL